jgi:hypothetical protein
LGGSSGEDAAEVFRSGGVMNVRQQSTVYRGGIASGVRVQFSEGFSM